MVASTRCYYDVLGLAHDATTVQIKKSYHALALKWHPDKNADSASATEMFKQVQEAWEVLSDPQERAYYDNNRDELLASDDEDEEQECNEVEAELDLYKWSCREAFVDFSSEEDGFFAVYTTVFRELDEQEQTARHGDARRPGFGGAGSVIDDVTAFYAYWLNFSTCRSDRAFAKHDKWDLSDAPSPLMRRLMQQKNKAIRDKARKMFNDKVRRLTKWVRSQDPRPCGHVDVVDAGEAAAQDGASSADDKGGTFRCAACNKWYKNASQLSNHEKSAKHKQMVAKLRKQLSEDAACKELEELGLDDDDGAMAAEARPGGGGRDGEDARGEVNGGSGGGGGQGKKKKKGRREGPMDDDGGAEDDGVDDADAATDAAIEQAVASTAQSSSSVLRPSGRHP